jgi:hypothetical protein
MPQDAAAAAGFKVHRDCFSFTATVDPASISATSVANTTVTVPAGCELDADDLIIAIAPSGFASALAILGCFYASITTFNLRLSNPTAGSVDAASGTWTFIVFRS